MAKQKSLIIFTGKLGNMIGYYRNGKHFLRRAPETVRQTNASRRAARRFGIASKKGALIRHAFYSQLDVHCDSSHINRLNRILIQASAGNPAAIKGFRFNQETGTDRFFSIAPQVADNGTLHIPAQTLPPLKGISALEIKVIAARISFAANQVINTTVETIVINTDEPFTGSTFSVDAKSTGTLVVTLQVRAITGEGISCNRKYLAADIIAVRDAPHKQVFEKPAYPEKRNMGQAPAALYYSTYRPPYMPAIQRE